jgi:hypothetical protein
MSKIELRASGWSKREGEVPTRIVLRVDTLDFEYAVHLHALHEGGVEGYHSGFYTHILEEAEKDFGTRAAKNLGGSIYLAAVVQWLRDNKKQKW